MYNIYKTPKADESIEDSQVTTETYELANEVEELIRVSNVIETQLVSVLRQSETSVAKNEKDLKNNLVPLAAYIRNIIEMIANNNEVLRSISERLEI